MDTVIQIALVVVAILIIIYAYYRIYCINIYRFYSPTCGPCVTSEGEWKRFKSSCMYTMLRPVDVDVSNTKNSELMVKFKISQTPTIVYELPSSSNYIYIPNASSVTAEQISDAVLFGTGKQSNLNPPLATAVEVEPFRPSYTDLS